MGWPMPNFMLSPLQGLTNSANGCGSIWVEASVNVMSRILFASEPVAPCHHFKLYPDGVHDRHNRPRLEHERRQHRAELVNGQRIIAIDHHIAAPIADPNHEHLDLEIV